MVVYSAIVPCLRIEHKNLIWRNYRFYVGGPIFDHLSKFVVREVLRRNFKRLGNDHVHIFYDLFENAVEKHRQLVAPAKRGTTKTIFSSMSQTYLVEI